MRAAMVTTSGIAGEATREITGGSVWLTYTDLAARLGIKSESAKCRAIERRWPKRLGNDGRSLVAVPIEVLEVTRETTGEGTGEFAGEVISDIASEVTSDTNALAEHLKNELEAARQDLKAMTVEALTAREREGRSAAEIEGLRRTLDGVHRDFQVTQTELRAKTAELMAAREREQLGQRVRLQDCGPGRGGGACSTQAEGAAMAEAKS